MIYCHGCHVFFEQPSFRREVSTERVLICPHCRGDDLEQACLCALCEEYHPVSGLSDRLCVACRRETDRRYNALLADFIPEQRDYIWFSRYVDGG